MLFRSQDEITLSTGQQALESHLTRFLADYPLEPGEVTDLRKQLDVTFRGWAAEGELGRRALRNIQTSGAYETVRKLLVGALPDATILALGGRKEARRAAGAERFRTDGRAEVPSGGAEPPEFKGANAALKALQWSKAHPESNPYRNRY